MDNTKPPLLQTPSAVPGESPEDSGDEGSESDNDAAFLIRAYSPRTAKEAESMKRTKWCLLGMLVLVVAVVVSFLALAAATTVVQYLTYEARNSDESAGNAITRRSFAFILSGPMTPLCMFFVGCVGAFVAYSLLKWNRIRLYFKTWHLALLFALCVIAIVFQLILVIANAKIVSKANEVNEGDLYVEGDDAQTDANAALIGVFEDDMHYLQGYSTAPLRSYVIGSNIYMLVALILLAPILCVIHHFNPKPRTVVPSPNPDPNAPKVKKATKLRVVLAVAYVAIALLCVACLSHFILVVLVVPANVYGSPLLDTQHYSVQFANSAIAYNFAFFLTGWMTYAALIGVYSRPGTVFFKLVTILVALAVLLLVLLQLFQFGSDGMVQPCGVSQGEVYPDGEVMFCTRSELEKDAQSGLHWWHIANAIVFAVGAFFAVVGVFLTLCGTAAIPGTGQRGIYDTTSMFSKAHASDAEDSAAVPLSANIKRQSASFRSELPRSRFFERALKK